MTRRFLLVLVLLTGCGQAEPPKRVPAVEAMPNMESVAATVRKRTDTTSVASFLADDFPSKDVTLSVERGNVDIRIAASNGYVFVTAKEVSPGQFKLDHGTIAFSQSGKRAE